MKVQELVRQTPFESVWEEYVALGHVPEADEAEQRGGGAASEASLERARRSVESAYSEMASLEGVEPSSDEYLVVAEGYKPTYVEDLFCPELEAFSVKRGAHDTWALALCPWRELLGFEAYQASVERYGAPRFLAEVLYELTFWGLHAADVDEARADLVKRLEAMQENGSDGSRGVSLEEMYGHFDLEPPTVEEEAEDERLERLEKPLREEYRRWLEAFLAGTGWAGYRSSTADLDS